MTETFLNQWTNAFCNRNRK